MISVQGYLHGNALYDQVHTVYGPVYYFYEWGLHKLAAIPLTNDATDALCVVHWIIGATLLAWAGFRLTRSALLAAFIFMQAVVHLNPMANEPGHPQEVVLVLLALACLMVAGGLKRRLTLPTLAAIGTCLLFTKINVGAFFGMALALSMLCCTTGGRFVRVGVWCVALISCAFPILLMQSHYDEPWARNYSVQMALSLLAVGLVANTYVTQRAIRLRNWIKAAGASAVVAGVIFLVLLATGSTLSAILESLVFGASQIGGFFYIPLYLGIWSWSAWTALAAALFTVCLKKHEPSLSLTHSLIKAVYGIIGTWVLVFEPTAQLGCLLPWAWLLIVGTNKADENLFPRIFLSFLAVWQGLQAYPVGGTQTSIGTIVGVLVFSVCLWDAFKALAENLLLQPSIMRMASLESGRLAQIGPFLVLLVLLAVFTMAWCRPIRNWRVYEAKQTMGLPGCYYRRVAPAVAIQYRNLAEFLKTHADAFIILPGLNSMYFWTGEKPPELFNVCGEGILPAKPQQIKVVQALKNARHPVVVLRDATWPLGTIDGEMNEGPLSDYIREQLKQIATIGRFRICAPKQSSKVSG